MYVIFYFAIPIFVLGFSKFIIGFMFMSVVTGITLSLVFQLAHVIELTDFTDATQDVDVRMGMATLGIQGIASEGSVSGHMSMSGRP